MGCVRRRNLPDVRRCHSGQEPCGRCRPRVGDKVIVPWRPHRNGTDVIGGWHPGEVVAKRRGRLVVLIYGHERDYAAFWVRPYPVRWQDWPVP